METREDEWFVAIVDDEAVLREATENLLKSTGFRTAGFASAEDFLQSACGKGAGCLILDVRLPGISGLELQRHLAGAGLCIPTVLTTAEQDRDGRIRSQAFRAGAVAFLHKPYSGDELLRAVQSVFGKRP
jgi:FixJ family two-component response regulator